ncbi:MAG: ABC transporter ATP-binding protein [Euzebyales bacterium]|nr:ABC transporter ATP-binding protein [Euzebyales bacterium]
MAEIRVEGLTKVYGKKVTAVDDVDLHVRDGEFMVLLGPSGCGKTTLLRAIAGLEYPEAGRITIGDRDVTDLPPRRRDLAMVFQSYAVFPHMNVADNIGFGLRMEGVAKHELRERVTEAARLVELGELLDRYPSQLSGGQRQRVAVARAVAMRPAVLLMDEPLSNLDALLRLNFRAELKKLVAELETTTLYVTHDQVEALSLGDRIAVMRQGRVVQSGTPAQIYDRPAERFVGGFIGTPPMNFVEATVHSENGRPALELAGHRLDGIDGVPAGAGERVLVGVRAEHIEAHDREVDGGLPARAEVVELLGSQLLVTAALGDRQVKLLTRADFPAQRGKQLWLRPEQDKLRFFDPETQQALAQ